MSPLRKNPEPPARGTGTRRTALDRLAIAIATAGGAGFAPKAPGTAGSLVGVVLYLGAAAAGLEFLLVPVALGLLGAGVWAAARVENIYGHDAPEIVIDEVVGQMITLGFVVRAEPSAVAVAAVTGFLIFRFFDILKPFPLRRLERFSGGVGVMADDVGAGIYGLLLLILLESSWARLW